MRARKTADAPNPPRAAVKLAMLGLVVAGCTGTPPIVSTPIEGPDVAEVRAAPGSWTGKKVRWGGEIVATENLVESTRIEVVARRLRRSGRPVDSDRTAGRFITEAAGFLEPTQYAPGRHITVVGTLAPPLTRNIGAHPYTYPVVEASTLYLWEERPDFYPYPYPYYGYDPFFRPYWYHPFPYYRPYYFAPPRRYYRPYPRRHLH